MGGMHARSSLPYPVSRPIFKPLVRRLLGWVTGLLVSLQIGGLAYNAFAGTAPTTASEPHHGEVDRRAEGVDQDPLADRLHHTISSGVLKAAETIDAFFYAPQAEIEENRTTLKVNLGLFLEAQERARLATGSRLKLVLPGFQDRLHLVLAGDPEEDDQVLGETIDKAPEGEVAQEEETGEISAALRYFVVDDIKRNLSFSAGVKILEGRLVGFPDARYRRVFDMGIRHSALRFEQRVVWYTNDGWRESTRLDLDTLVAPHHLLRTSVEGIWEEVRGGYRYDLRLSFFQPVGGRAALRYEWINGFNVCTADQLDKILLKISYRQSFWRPWLFFEFAPQLAYPQEKDFKVTPGLMIRLEAIFGYRRKSLTE